MNILQKSRRLSYVVLRLAAYVRRREFKERLEYWAFELLEGAAADDFEKALTAIDVIEALIRFGESIYEIEPINSTVVIQELSTVNAAIRQLIGKDELPDFRTMIAGLPDSLPDLEKPNKNGDFDEIEPNDGYDNSEAALMRQSAVLKKIRQYSKIGGCRIGDLAEAFPDISERTLRYDLQKLINQKMVYRSGSMGPGTTYHIEESKL
ncbi:MAG: hypothetical protein ABH822_02045 [Patescibacteria group bacterium]